MWVSHYNHNDAPVRAKIFRVVRIGFFGMLILSFVQSFSFSVSYENVVIYLSFGLVVVGLFMPIYRAECIFGYVFGSIVFSGSIIPLVGILLIAGIPWSSHVCIKPLVFRVFRAQPQ